MINLELKNDEDISKEIKLYQKNCGIFNVDYVISSSLVKKPRTLGAVNTCRAISNTIIFQHRILY